MSRVRIPEPLSITLLDSDDAEGKKGTRSNHIHTLLNKINTPQELIRPIAQAFTNIYFDAGIYAMNQSYPPALHGGITRPNICILCHVRFKSTQQNMGYNPPPNTMTGINIHTTET